MTLYGGVNATAAVALVPPAQATKVAAKPTAKPTVRKPTFKPTVKMPTLKPTMKPTKRVATEGVALLARSDSVGFTSCYPRQSSNLNPAKYVQTVPQSVRVHY